MVIDLTTLEEDEGSWNKQVEPEEINLTFSEYEFSDPVHVDLHINYTENQYIIRGRIATKAHTHCVKCLVPFELPVNEEVGWVVQVVSDPKIVANEEELEDFWFIEKGECQLDITSRVREAVLICLPDHPVCRKDCPGLCSQCGENLNEGPCGCATVEIDSRWAPLKDLLGRNKKSPEL